MSGARRLYLSQRTSQYVTEGPRRWFQVFIHPTAEHFREAAQRYSGGNFGNALGCCHPAPLRMRCVDGEWQNVDPTSWAGILRFVEGHVTTEIVAHEIAHAALVVYRMDVKPRVVLGNGCGKREEALCYITGDLLGAASTMLHDAGVWSA